MNRIETNQKIEAFDSGIANAFTSTQKFINFSPEQERSMEKAENRKKFYQRQAARQKNGSKRKAKTRKKIARKYEKQQNVRKDFHHKETRKIVDDPKKQVFVKENLKIKNMTASATGTIEEPGKNVAQKSGLNRDILNVGWGQFFVFLNYKAIRAGKIMYSVSAQHTSQECYHCGHIHKDNRLEQSEFVCVKCGHKNHADKNAAFVIRRRAVELILGSGTELDEKGVLRKPKPSTSKGRYSSKKKSSGESSTTRLKRDAA
jgi:putative transposase